MKILKCLIVDDEAPAVRLLETYVKQVSFLQLVNATTSAIEALAIIEKEEIDLLFLDIQMPTITGIQLSKIVGDKMSVIFTTAYPQFAIESYELNSVDYLLKPFDFERFYSAVLKVKPKEINEKVINNDNFIFVKTDGKNNFEKIYTKDILYIESLKNYVCINVLDKQIITYNTLKHFENELSTKKFIKIHKSFIVSIQNIYKTDTFCVHISDGKQLPIGDTFKKQFFEVISKLTI